MHRFLFCIAVLGAFQSGTAWSREPLQIGQQVLVVYPDILFPKRDDPKRFLQEGDVGKVLEVRRTDIRLDLGWVSSIQVKPVDEALKDMSELLNRRPNGHGYAARGRAYYNLGKFDLAIADLNDAIRSTSIAGCYALRGLCWEQKKEPEKALADYNAAITLAWRQQGHLVLGEARQGNAFAYGRRERLWRDKGEYERALFDLNMVLWFNPKADLAYHHRAMCWQQLGDRERAIRDYDRYIALNPSASESYYRRGVAYLQMGDIDKGLQDLNETLRLDPEHAGAYINRGAAWLDKGDLERAIADCTVGIRLKPEVSALYSNRGLGWQRMGKFKRAIADFEQCLKLEPGSREGSANLAWLLATCSEEAFRDGKRAVELATTACERGKWADFYSLNALAASCAEAGDFAAAVKHQLRAIELTPVGAMELAKMQERLELYRVQKPCREAVKK